MPERPTLLPREHGAYAQLAFPLATGLALAWPASSALALGAATLLFFLAHEPLAVVLGIRGARLRGSQGDRARIRASVLLGTAAVSGGVGLYLGWREIWPLVLVPGLAALLLLPMVLTGRQKSLPGEILVLTAFSTLVLPLGAASGVGPIRGGLASAVWWVAFLLGTLEVHAIKARTKKASKEGWTRWASPLSSCAALLAAVWLALGQATPVLRAWAGHPGAGPFPPELVPALPPAGAALLPPALATFVLSLLRVHPRNLKRVGWTLVGADFLALVALLQG